MSINNFLPNGTPIGKLFAKTKRREQIMTITKKQNGTTLEIALEGRLDTTTSPELEKELDDVLDGVEELIMDFSNLEYISSAGLRVLLSVHKALHNKGRMKVVNPNEIVREVFEVTGFDNILTIE